MKRIAIEDGSSTFQRTISLLDMVPNEVGQLCHCFRDGELVSYRSALLLYRVTLTQAIDLSQIRYKSA